MISFYNIEIVYPESPENERLALNLKKKLEDYRIPREVSRKTGIRSIAEVKEPTLIVLCMPESRYDPGVEEAILRYTEAGRYHRIIALIISGASGDRFPEALLHERRPDGTVIDREPLAANLSAPTERERNRKLEVEKLRIMATILGVGFDDLRNRRRRQRMRVAAGAGAVVLAGALAFLGYALSRVRTLSGQNETLQARYDEAHAAEEEAQAQRTAAREDFARTTAVRARSVLEEGDSELALLMVLEMLPEMQHVQEVREVLEDALGTLCGSGYVPLTKLESYTRNRFDMEPSRMYAEPEEVRKRFPAYQHPPVPEDVETGLGYEELYQEIHAKDLSVGLYHGYFHVSDEQYIRCMYVHFPDQPELDHWLRQQNGEHVRLKGIAFLPDGSLIGIDDSEDGMAYRFDLTSDRPRAFFDEDGAGAGNAGTGTGENKAGTDAAAGAVRLRHPVEAFAYFEGMDVVFGYSADAMEVYSLEPFQYLGTMEGISWIYEIGGMNYLYAAHKKEGPIRIWSRDPFRELFTVGEENTDGVGDSPNVDFLRLSDGREFVERTDILYELPAGEKTPLYGDGGLMPGETGSRYAVNFSSEGWACIVVRDENIILDLSDGSIRGRIPYSSFDSPGFYGQQDGETGRISAGYFGSGGIVYQYREKEIEVPADIDGQIALARELLGDRELGDSERREWHLD